jgi:hypothetical protein
MPFCTPGRESIRSPQVCGCFSPAIAGLVASWAGPSASFLLGGAKALSAVLIAATVMPSVLAVSSTKVPSRRLGFRK